MLTGNNGILTQAVKAKEETELASEKEGISLDVIEYQMDENNKTKLGTTLYDKNQDNSAIWDVVVDNINNITYGTDWNYIGKGTKVENYGETKNEWLVNYETGEIIQIDDNYTHLTHGDSIGVTDGLIFNLDPSVIDTTDVEDLKSGNYESLWQNTTLNGFDWTNESGFTSTEFNFDGVDDYITVQYDSQEQKNALAQNGFTFEYYGTIDQGTSYNEKKEIINPGYTGIFCYWNGNEKAQARFRFGMRNAYWLENKDLCFEWNAGLLDGKEGEHSSDFSEPGYPNNVWYPLKYEYGEENYFTITLDTTSSYEKDGEEYYKQTLYLKGEKLYEGGYNKKQWEYFVNNELEKLNYFCIGRSSMSNEGWWMYGKLNAYTLRLYNHALTESEVKDNYQKSVAYHESLQ